MYEPAAVRHSGTHSVVERISPVVFYISFVWDVEPSRYV